MTNISSIIFDCADPAALAAFYAAAIGGQVTHSDADFAAVGGGPVELGFQRVDGYQGPGWPGAAKHAHLDLRVDDLDTARKELVGLGAAVPDWQPGDGAWLVLTDPEGHPFCVSAG
ncbi:VOC family protein [Nonomuraea cavernae]|uniref:VOC family protein n=1 Tax=Nonomuraea cavernae TaxID=2045107 RepID=UPI0033F66E80